MAPHAGRRLEQGGLLQGQRDSLERKGIQGSLRRERGDGGKVWLGGVAGKGGARKLCSRTEGEATERPQASAFFLILLLRAAPATH